MKGLLCLPVNVELVYPIVTINLLCFIQSEIIVITLAGRYLPQLLPDLLLHSEHDLPIVEALVYNITN